MPIYEYYCDACNLEFEALVPMSQKDDARCEKCGGKVQRIASCCFGFSDSPSSPVGAPVGC
jgi:putative FmdB family regulatory protein